MENLHNSKKFRDKFQSWINHHQFMFINKLIWTHQKACTLQVTIYTCTRELQFSRMIRKVWICVHWNFSHLFIPNSLPGSWWLYEVTALTQANTQYVHRRCETNLSFDMQRRQTWWRLRTCCDILTFWQYLFQQSSSSETKCTKWLFITNILNWVLQWDLDW